MESLLNAFLQNPQEALSRFQQPSALQEQTGNTFSQLLSGLAGPRQTGVANTAIQDIISGGEGVVSAAQPVFNQNLQRSADILRQSGPRFATSTNQQIADLSQRSINDFNLFAQNVLESGRNRQLQALLGGLQGAGSFANQQQQLQLPLIQQLLSGAFNTGVGPGLITQGASPIDLIGQIGALVAAAGGIPGGGGAGGTPGNTPSVQVPQRTQDFLNTINPIGLFG